MGAILVYEYMRKFPDNVGDIIIISGFIPKFPTTNAEFHAMFTSQVEREKFATRPELGTILNKLKQQADTTSREYLYLKYKIKSASMQFYDINQWKQAVCGKTMFNPEMNDIIGPESHISWPYMVRFYFKQRDFYNGSLDTLDNSKFSAPIDYTTEIQHHNGRIDYLLGTHEVGDWNLRLYRKTIEENEKVKMHVFQNAGHNIWVDRPEAFHNILSQLL